MPPITIVVDGVVPPARMVRAPPRPHQQGPALSHARTVGR